MSENLAAAEIIFGAWIERTWTKLAGKEGCGPALGGWFVQEQAQRPYSLGLRLSIRPPYAKRPCQRHDLLTYGGSGWIRTTEVVDNRFTVCPLWPLGNAPICSCRLSLRGEGGAGRRTRTPDLLITNQLLYQLSYTSAFQNNAYHSRLSRICQPKILILGGIFFAYCT